MKKKNITTLFLDIGGVSAFQRVGTRFPAPGGRKISFG